MAQPSIDDLVKDLFFIKKIKDEIANEMGDLAEGFFEVAGTDFDHYMEHMANILKKLNIAEQTFITDMVGRHNKVMLLFSKMICGIEEVLRE